MIFTCWTCRSVIIGMIYCWLAGTDDLPSCKIRQTAAVYWLYRRVTVLQVAKGISRKTQVSKGDQGSQCRISSAKMWSSVWFGFIIVVLFGLLLLFVFVSCNVFMLWCLHHVLCIMLSCNDDLWTPETRVGRIGIRKNQVSFGNMDIFHTTIWTEILTLTVQSISVLLFLKVWSSSSTSAWLWRGKWRTASMAETSGCVCCQTVVVQVCVWCEGAGEPRTHRADWVMFTHQLVPNLTKAHLKFMRTRGAADVDAA